MTAPPGPTGGLSSQAEAALLDTEQEESPLLGDDEEPSHSPVYQVFAFLARGEGALWTFAVFVLICIVFGIAAPDFFSRANWVATSEYAVEYLLLAIGETFVIATAGIDLSVGAILGFSAMLSAVIMSGLLNGHMSSILVTIIGFAIALAAGTLVGVANGLLITRLKLTPFIVTLGMLGMCTGATYLLDDGNQVSNLPSQITTIGTTIWFGGWLPAIVVVAAVFTILGWLLLSRTRFGLHTYVIGSNFLAGQRAGVNVNRHLVRVYALSGFLAAVAGLMVTAKFTIASPIAGANDELDAIAAVVIGGASLSGGRGTVLNTLVGVITLGVIGNIMNLASVPGYHQQVVMGVIIIVAILAQRGTGGKQH